MSAINKNNTIAKVLSIIGDEMNGDSVMLVDGHMFNALKTTCKFVAENKPLGHEKLLLTQALTSAAFSATTGFEFVVGDLTQLTYPIVNTGVFHNILLRLDYVGHPLIVQGDSRGYPVKSMSALSLALTHGVFYYFIEPENFFINAPVNVTINTAQTTANLNDEITAVYITHYIYATAAQFPEELEDLLIAELVRLVSNERNKQMQEGDV